MKLNKLYIEITNVCNMECCFCIQNSRQPAFMEADVFESIIKQWKVYSDKIYLHVLGEPLLHPQLDELLKMSDNYQMKVTITTNGSLLKEKVNILKKHNSIHQINISVHNFNEQKIDMKTYISNCIEVGYLLSHRKVNVNYRFWNQRNGVIDKETEEVLSLFKKEYEMQLNHSKEKLSDYQYIHFDEVFEWPSLHLPKQSKQGKCLGVRNQLAVLVDGTVVPCCLDAKGQIPLGNLINESFDIVLRSTRLNNIKKGFEDNKVIEELCRHCSFRLRFQ